MDRPSYRSFLVRIWREPSGDCWRGEVESIQSGVCITVESLDQAFEIIQQAARTVAPPAASALERLTFGEEGATP